MNILTYGDQNRPAILFLHGMASTARLCFAEVAERLSSDFCCLLCELDGHEEMRTSTFHSITHSCEWVERTLAKRCLGKIYGLCGYSLGATIAVELLARNHIQIERAVLDAAFCVRMGLLGSIYREIFVYGVRYLQSGRRIHPRLTGLLFGRGNDSAMEIFYPDVTAETIRNACQSVSQYKIPKTLASCQIPILFLRGEREPYPRKSAILLKRILPQMEERVFPTMGHGQYLHEHPEQYTAILQDFFYDALVD